MKITLTGEPTNTGVGYVTIYVGSQRFEIEIKEGMTAKEIEEALIAAGLNCVVEEL